MSSSCGFVGSTAIPANRFAIMAVHHQFMTGSDALTVSLHWHAMKRGMRWAGCQLSDRWIRQNLSCLAKHTSEQAKLQALDFETRHLLELPEWWLCKPDLKKCDFCDGQWFDQLLVAYESLLGSSVHLFIPVKEAHSHLWSVLQWTQTPFAQFNVTRKMWNPLAKTWRLLEEEHVEHFIAGWPFNRSSRLHVMLADRPSESLVMFRRTLNWSLRDALFVTGSSVEKAFVQVPSDPPVLYEHLAVDQKIYKKLHAEFEAELHGFRSKETGFEREVLAHERIMEALPGTCGQQEAHMPDSLLAQLCRAHASEVDVHRYNQKYHCIAEA